jgi:hypothetical protein
VKNIHRAIDVASAVNLLLVADEISMPSATKLKIISSDAPIIFRKTIKSASESTSIKYQLARP